MHRQGRVYGIPRDADASIRFLELAAQQRHPAACFLLAVIALSGTRGSRDPARAYHLLVAAAEEVRRVAVPTLHHPTSALTLKPGDCMVRS